jgi:replicative DNA helicase
MIAKAYLSLHQRGIKIDWLTLLPELGEEGLKSCGGEDYILQLVEVVPSAASTPFYIESLSRFAALAYIKARAKQIDRMVTEQKPLEEVVEAYQKPLSIGAGTRLRKLSDVDATKRDTGVTTGFSQLDRLISTKGYPSGQVTVVRARHKGGKSAFMIGSARAMCDRGAKVLYMTVADLNAVRLKQRMTRNICGFSTLESAMEEGTEADVESVRRALRQIERYSIHVYDGSKVDGGHEVETVCASIIEAVNEYGIEAVFIDYAQKLATRQHFRGNGTAEQDYICAMVSRTAERMGVATVVASQITVDKATGQVTTKNSRKWEEDCGWLLSVRQDSVEVSLSRFGPDTARNTELGKPAVGAAYRFNEERLRLDMI